MTKDKLTSIFLALLITIVAGLIFYFLFFQTKSVDVKVEATKEQSDLNKNNQNLGLNVKDITCHENSKYFIIVQKLQNEVGSNFLIKEKNSDHQIINCSYTVELGDFELKNIDEADYFFALENNFLILDNGTGSRRALIVYDLNTRKKVFKDIYFGVTDIKDSQIIYWTTSIVEPTQKNCPKLGEYLSYGGGGAEMQKKVILDLTNLIKKDLNETRCSYVE